MNHKIIAAITAAGLLISPFLYAQKKVYSLEQIWQKTLSQYPSLSSKKYQIERQELNEKLVKKEWLPEVNFQAQQSYGSYQGVSGSFFPLAGNYNTSGATKNLNGESKSIYNAYSSAVLQWNFLQFGRIKSKLNVADAAIRLSNTALSQEQLQLQIAAAQQYFNVLQSNAFLSTAKADVQRLQDLFELSKAQADAGLRPGADTLLVKSNYFQIKGQVNDQEALLQTAMMQLSALIGEDADSFTLDSSFYNSNKIASQLPSADSMNEHPYLQFLRANMLYANATLEAVKHQPYPSVGLLAGTGIRGSGINNSGMANNNFSEPWKNPTGSYLVGVGVTWKLSSLYENKVKQKMAEKEIQSANANYDEGKLQLETSYNAAVSRWKQQREKVIDAQIALEASHEAYDLYVTRYENGLINLIELLQLQKTLQDAENNYVKTTGAYWNELINQSGSTGSLKWLLFQINL
jgi:outer membrane protein TolC